MLEARNVTVVPQGVTDVQAAFVTLPEGSAAPKNPFKAKEVRQAIQLAIDRERLISRLATAALGRPGSLHRFVPGERGRAADD